MKKFILMVKLSGRDNSYPGGRLLMILTALLLCVALAPAPAAAAPEIEWQRCLGGTDEDTAYSIQQTRDGGYIVAGKTKSIDGDVTGNHGDSDAWVVKLDASGAIEWQKCYGGTKYDSANSIQQTRDGGYIFAGETLSNDGDVDGNHDDSGATPDVWVVKLNASGDIVWQRCYGGSGEDYAFSIRQTSDGGYIVAGYTESNDGDVYGNHGLADMWVIKLDALGAILWQKCLGGTSNDIAHSAQQTSDGGYIVAGYTRSNNGNVAGNHGFVDAWVVKLDASGTIQWQKCLGGSSEDAAYSIQQTSDGGYIFAGYAGSNDGDVSGNHGFGDVWVVKLNPLGVIMWQKCLGGSSTELAYSVQQTSDDGYVVAGYTMSNNGDVSGKKGLIDMWVVKLDRNGRIEWQKCLGGSNQESATSIQQTSDGGFIIAGITSSPNDGDVSGNHGGLSDAWVVKLAPIPGGGGGGGGSGGGGGGCNAGFGMMALALCVGGMFGMRKKL